MTGTRGKEVACKQGAGGTTGMTPGSIGKESVAAAHLSSEGIDPGLWCSETKGCSRDSGAERKAETVDEERKCTPEYRGEPGS